MPVTAPLASSPTMTMLATGAAPSAWKRQPDPELADPATCRVHVGRGWRLCRPRPHRRATRTSSEHRLSCSCAIGDRTRAESCSQRASAPVRDPECGLIVQRRADVRRQRASDLRRQQDRRAAHPRPDRIGERGRCSDTRGGGRTRDCVVSGNAHAFSAAADAVANSVASDATVAAAPDLIRERLERSPGHERLGRQRLPAASTLPGAADQAGRGLDVDRGIEADRHCAGLAGGEQRASDALSPRIRRRRTAWCPARRRSTADVVARVRARRGRRGESERQALAQPTCARTRQAGARGCHRADPACVRRTRRRPARDARAACWWHARQGLAPVPEDNDDQPLLDAAAASRRGDRFERSGGADARPSCPTPPRPRSRLAPAS
jgi:hypothetical protein